MPCLYASLVSFLVALAANPSINLPILLGKSSDGTFPIWSLVMFSPYLYFVRGFSALRRMKSAEPPYSEISEGLYVGGWPCSPDKLPPGNPAIIDCTCEMPRMLEVTGNHAFLCIPTWDTRSPQPADIEAAVKWACRKRAQNIPAFIHCAYGSLKSISKAFGLNSFSKFKVSTMAFYKVKLIDPNGIENDIEVLEDRYILNTAADAGMKLPYSCRVGTCGTCAGQLSSSSVDQSEGTFLDESLIEKGYVLTCISYSKEDCVVRTHKQEELVK